MKKDDNKSKPSSNIELLKKQIEDMYQSTYYTQDKTDDIKDNIINNLDDAIQNSTQRDDNFQNISSTSKLYRKLLMNSNGASSKLDNSFGRGDDKDISSIFQNTDALASIMDSYSKVKWVTELDNEFDLICKYMTKLQVALDLKRDAVLCSDTYTKQFLNVRAKGENPSSDQNASIQNNINDMLNKYNLAENTEKWYENASKYGEEFVYCVPYKSAINNLLKRKNNTNYFVKESSIVVNDKPSGFANINNKNGEISINIHLDTSKIIAEVVNNDLFIRKNIGDDRLKGLSEDYINETQSSFEDHLKKSGNNNIVKFDNTVPDNIKYEDDDKMASSGLINPNKIKNDKLKINGAIVHSIRHDKIIPVYIEDTMFGAYYIKFNLNNDITAGLSELDSTNSMNSIFNKSNAELSSEDETYHHDMLLRKISGEISQKIDSAFINANADLKKEIYLMLKFNDTYNRISNNVDMDITFIPSDDIHHLRFKEDNITHRGISDLWDTLVPAKQWITLSLTSILGMTTRSFDRRVYYVKQSLDTNVAQSLLNVISTIKKGNFGARQMESVNNILNIVGRYNDFVIPISPSGDAPIQFDTMPGQQIDFPDNLLTNLEESAVNSTGVPLEIVNSSTGMDFAVRYTMTNAKLLRNVLKRQLKMEEFLSKIFTKIYKFEFDENVDLEVTLPPPAFLSMSQGTQLLSSATQYADSITEVEMANESDDAKIQFKKRIVRKLIPSYLSDEEIKSIKDNISIDMTIEKSMNKNDDGDNTNGSDDGY